VSLSAFGFKGLHARLERIPSSAYIVLITCLIALLLLLSADFGESWDVMAQDRIAERAFIYYFHGLDGGAFLRNNRDSSFGPLVDLFIKFAQYGSQDPQQRHTIRIFVQALLSLSCLIPFFLISKMLMSKPLALIAVGLLLATPAFFGHAFINPKDTIFASGFLWTLFLILARLRDVRPRHGAYLTIGALLGAISSLRFLAVYLIILVFLVAIVIPAVREQSPDKLALKNITSRIWCQLSKSYIYLALLFVSLIITYSLCMPRILSDPSLHSIFGVLRRFTRDTDRMDVLYFGSHIPDTELPWHFIYGYMFVQLPLYYHLFLFVIIAAIIAWPHSTFSQFKEIFKKKDESSWALVCIFIALATPLITIFAARPVLYDGFRHVLFVVPLICLLLYCGFMGVLSNLSRLIRGILIVIATLCWIQSVLALKALHPYEYVYYNPLVNPADTFELDYWATSFRQIADWLNGYALRNRNRGEKFRVSICGPRWPLVRFLDAKRFEVVRLGDNDPLGPELTVGLNRFNCLDHLKKPWLMSVKRGTLVFAVVAPN
jgi:hypothetical protein